MNIFPENKITGLVITLNEEHNIKSIIENLDFVDELIIVDSFSTDNTVAVIKSFPHVTLVQNKFENYSTQRNLALSLATNRWILFLDADERITPKLKEEILTTVNLPDPKNAYFFYRKFMFGNRPLNFSGWQTDKNIRLFKKNTAHYVTDRLVHEKLNTVGTVGKLRNKLIHYSYTDYETYKAKMINYGKLKAKEKFMKNFKPSLLRKLFHPAYNFMYSFIIRLGFLDGKKGFIICYLNAYSVYIRYKELKKLWKQA